MGVRVYSRIGKTGISWNPGGMTALGLLIYWCFMIWVFAILAVLFVLGAIGTGLWEGGKWSLRKWKEHRSVDG